MTTAGAQGITVVKLGGRTQSAPSLPGALAALWTRTGGRLVIVHGGGDQISAMQRLQGEQPIFVHGRRFTSPLVLELIRMVLSGSVNKQLVSLLTAAGLPAVGISGEDTAMIPARVVDAATFGAVGSPNNPNPAIVHHLLSGGFLPVISPVGTDADDTAHGPVNINGDDAASALAVALRAQVLLLMVDVPGVLDANKTLVPSLDTHAAQALVDSGVASGGMSAKLESCLMALSGGVPDVRIGDITLLDSPGAGTAIVQ